MKHSSNSTTPPRIVSLGEVLWDLFPTGARFGGAPANLACHAAMLGAEVQLVSRIGRDKLGDEAIQFLRGAGLSTAHIQRDTTHATGTVNVQVDGAGKPSFEIVSDVAWDYLDWRPEMSALAKRADVICFGTLGQRHPIARATIQRVLSAGSGCRLLDLNLRAPFYHPAVIVESLEAATALKLNDEELAILAPLLALPSEERDRIRALQDRFQLDWVCLTRGSAGSLIASEDGISDFPGTKIPIVDTVGAGDAFTAATLVGLAAGRALADVHVAATSVASYVCSQAGAVPKLPAELIHRAGFAAGG